MEAAVKPVLHEIREEHNLNKLQQQRLTGNHRAKSAGPRSVAQDGERRCERQVGQCLNKQCTDEKVEQVFPPLTSKDGLVPLFEQSFYGDEDGAQQDQIQQEKVQPQVDIGPTLETLAGS